MRILMISNHLGVQSGVQRYVQNLLLHLDTAKYRVTLFVGQCPPDQASTAPALEAHGVEILAVPDNKKDRIRALAAHLRTHKDYDIIHYHTASKIGAPVCGMMRVLCPRAKIVVHSHIVYPPMTLTWRAAHLVYQLFADYFLGCGDPRRLGHSRHGPAGRVRRAAEPPEKSAFPDGGLCRDGRAGPALEAAARRHRRDGA